MAFVSVDDVLRIPVLRAAGPRVLAGAGKLGRSVRWVHSAELADIAPLLREGDLLLSTGIAMPDSAEELTRFAASLADTGAAGLVVELGRRWHEVPQALVEACDRVGLPLVSLAREVPFAAVTQSIGERIVAEQVEELREAQRIHETFTALSIAEAGPDKILEAVQRLSGATVVLESEQHQVLDYLSGSDDVDALLGSWSTRSRAVGLEGRTTWDEANGWLVTRVGRRERGWGRLVLQLPGPPSERTMAIAERAAAALALHRLHDRQRDSALRRTHHELLLGLLADPTSEDLLRRCELAGLPTARRQLVGISVRPVVDASSTRSSTRSTPAIRLDEAIAAIVQAAHEQRVPALVCELEGDLRVLLSFTASANADKGADELAARVRRRQAVTVCAGRPVRRAAEIDRTLREAQHVLESLRPGVPDRVVHRLEHVHLRGLLALLADDDRLALFVQRELGALREHDTRTGEALTDAVRALVNHPTSKSEAAACLHISRPVFYDRLAKVGRLLGVDLDDPDIRVSLHVALLADELRREPAG